MSLQLDFSKIIVPLDSKLTDLLSAVFRQEADEHATQNKLVMQFPDANFRAKDIFLLHTRAIDSSTHLIEKVYCIKESKHERYVWALIASDGEFGTPLQLQFCQASWSLIDVLQYWQRKVLADIAQYEIDINYDHARIEDINDAALQRVG
ncbi:hypothetical protein [Planctobacterium marinum]|uniref:hypothetical protein n=1 Tax=Planctobacterium marinum TaxID=1631968 RepID=UPI001E471D10|nr:hypothetical protein [Planctobacterium marinum]MCC2606808.1 hypothetical protein [Planctobacterium marinum]